MGSGVGAADADVVEFAAGAEADVAGFADLVVADPVVGVGAAVAGVGFGPGVIGGGGGGLLGQGPVRPLVVVSAGERIKEGLQLSEGGGLGVLGAEPFLGRLLKPFDFALGQGLTGQSRLILWITVPGFRGALLISFPSIIRDGFSVAPKWQRTEHC